MKTILRRLTCILAGHEWGHWYEGRMVMARCLRCGKKVGCPA